MNDARVRLLVTIVAALAALRFIVVPWMSAQNEKREQLQVLTQRLDRSEGVVQNREAIAAARKALGARAESLRGRFPQAPGADAFRLDAQRRIGELARSAGVELEIFDWILEGENADAQLAYGRARLALEGPLRNVVRLHAELEGSSPNAAVRDVQLTLRAPAAGPGDIPANATMIVDLYYRKAGA